MTAPTDGPRPYLDRAAVAAVFGVTATAVAHWQTRHPDFPPPDILLGDRRLPGWRPDRIAEIRDWHHNRPGQGAPGKPKPGSGRRPGSAETAAAETHVVAAPGDDVPNEAEEPEPDVQRRVQPDLGEGWMTTSYGADDPDRTLRRGDP